MTFSLMASQRKKAKKKITYFLFTVFPFNVQTNTENAKRRSIAVFLANIYI